MEQFLSLTGDRWAMNAGVGFQRIIPDSGSLFDQTETYTSMTDLLDNEGPLMPVLGTVEDT